MTNIFLKAKHWQLFLLMIGIPLISKIYMYATLWIIESAPTSEMETKGFSQVLDEKFIQFDWYLHFLLLFSLLFFGWLWSLAIGLQKWVPDDIHIKTARFKIFFFIPLVYILFIITYMSGIFTGNASAFFLNSGTIIAVMVLLHLFSIFCIFYCIYFSAKTIKTVQLERKVRFGDFVGEFFLLWFYFIGIWIIQPKVNQLYEKNKPQSTR